ncbi:fibroblast growth factor-binding protein 1 [Trachemys scripta elegans]|uniref:fibroblast growth factor-binding protein 1 n=1 Tax=Trachemys scripta elegans TaxID=31138 RepID=UPI001556E3C4|nr:fibroblast growth factor-binding protein 1 [Trachemys scripta elegans]
MNIRSFALLFVLILLSQTLVVDGETQKERKKERQNGGKGRKKQTGTKQENEKGQESKGGKSSLKGKFTTKDNSDCTWAVTEVDTVTLKVECKKGESSFRCDFSGSPSTCPQFAANQKPYWKQISRSLKKQKNICQDAKGILKSKVCKKGPQSAHLTLTSSSLITLQDSRKDKTAHHGKEITQTSAPAITPENQPGKSSNDCVEDIDYIDQQKVAEEYCSETWRSWCNFFITMIQDKKCR